jgi:hypothetical protein
VKIIEGQIEAGRQYGQIVRPNSCATVRHIGDVAGADPELALEEKQSAFLDARPANQSPIVIRTRCHPDPDGCLRTLYIASDARHVGATRARAPGGRQLIASE